MKSAILICQAILLVSLGLFPEPWDDTTKDKRNSNIPGAPNDVNSNPKTLWQRFEEGRDRPKALMYLPTLVVGASVVYNLPGVQHSICLRGETLRGIYSGRITRWNDERIKAMNQGIRLPSARIRFLSRDDENGVNKLAARYLSSTNASSGRASEIEKNTSSPAGISVHNEEELIAKIKTTAYSIGFADFYTVKSGQIAQAALQNRAGICQVPSVESLQAAAEAAADNLQFDSELNAVDVSAHGAYPITGFSGLIIGVYEKPDQKAATVIDLLRYILTDGQKLATDSGYVALPSRVIEQELKALRMIDGH